MQKYLNTMKKTRLQNELNKHRTNYATLDEMAKTIGISRKSLFNYINGVIPNITAIKKIEPFIGYSINVKLELTKL